VSLKTRDFFLSFFVFFSSSPDFFEREKKWGIVREREREREDEIFFWKNMKNTREWVCMRLKDF